MKKLQIEVTQLEAPYALEIWPELREFFNYKYINERQNSFHETRMSLLHNGAAIVVDLDGKHYHVKRPAFKGITPEHLLVERFDIERKRKSLTPLTPAISSESEFESDGLPLEVVKLIENSVNGTTDSGRIRAIRNRINKLDLECRIKLLGMGKEYNTENVNEIIVNIAHKLFGRSKNSKRNNK